ncbi:MAG: TIGR04255 family protein [Chloroflexota bacterium]|nr:TIGR04255 family protein [Chloroflexota bacterium]
MSKELHYKNSPLTEAVIDLQVTVSEEVTLEALASMQSEQKHSYPTRRDQMYVEGQFSVDPETPPASGIRTQRGYAFLSDDERQIFQARLDGFTFSRLAPYENWESFRDEARRLWTVYRAITKPQKINRLAVRYINRLDLPLPFDDFNQYLRTVPVVSPELPQALNSYFMQLQIPYEDLSATLILNQALLPLTDPDKVPILLDIDIFRDTDMAEGEESIWEFFEKLRSRKNDVFEACITEQMKELIR